MCVRVCGQRADLIREFKDDYATVLPPPFNLIQLPIELPFRIARGIRNLFCKCCTGSGGPPAVEPLSTEGFKLYAADSYQETLERREHHALEACVTWQDEVEAGKVDNLVVALRDKMVTIGTEVSERLEARMERLENQIEAKFEKLMQFVASNERRGRSPSRSRLSSTKLAALQASGELPKPPGVKRFVSAAGGGV